MPFIFLMKGYLMTYLNRLLKANRLKNKPADMRAAT
jgi:hypothetical protein